MDQAMKAKFILALHKHSLQAFDAGGTVLAGPDNGGTSGPGGIAGAVGDFLGTNPGSAKIQAGTNAAQLNNSYTGAQQGLAGQQAFLNQAAAQGGFGNQGNVFAQQQALSNQLQQQANGQGPNPAQAALNQATGANVANQAALMAGQRGSSANAGLIARQAAQQGAATQQQAVGQGATLQAQQQLAAQAALANQQAQMQGVAANQIAAQGQAATNFSNAQQNEQNILQGANTAYNNSSVGMQSNINNQQAGNSIIGGLGSMLSNVPVIGGLFAKGGEVEKESPSYPPAMFAGGGLAPPPLMAPQIAAPIQGPQSFAGQWLNSTVPMSEGPNIGTPAAKSPSDDSGDEEEDKKPGGPTTPFGAALSGGSMSAGAGEGATAMDAAVLSAQGGKVKASSPNQKAVKKDNSYSNDKVPALLSEGEIVIPRSIAMHPMAPEKAAQFVQAVLNKRRMGGKA